MKRFLIFVFLFPAIATVSLYAALYLLSGAMVDSFSGPAFMYLLAMAPGLAVAFVDWLIGKTLIPAVIGTTVSVYAVLVLFLAWEGSAPAIFGLGLVGAIPAAICSWLSREA